MKQKGFTLVEVVIVVAILSTIAISFVQYISGDSIQANENITKPTVITKDPQF